MMTAFRRARFEAGIKAVDIMIKTGISVSRLSLLEHGYYKPRPKEAWAIAKALGLSVADVFPNGNGGPK